MAYISVFLFLSFSLGILSASLLHNIHISIYLLLLFLLLPIFFRGYISLFFFGLFLFLLGFFSYQKDKTFVYPKDKFKAPVFVECTVSSIPKKTFDNYFFKCDVINSNNAFLLDRKINVYLKDLLNEKIFLNSRIAFFSKVYGDDNLYFFPIKGFLTVDNSENIFFYLFSFREFLIERYNRFSTSQEAFYLGKALIFGEKGDIPKDIRNSFIETGLIHLLAISGMHVGIFIGLVSTILFFVRTDLKNKIFLFILPLYAFLTGFNLPVLRASLMAFLYFLGKVLYLKVDLLNVLFLVAFFVLIFSPESLFSPSFQLSFSATLGIILALKNYDFSINTKYILAPFYTSLIAVLFTLPVLIYHFGGFSLSSVIFTPFVLPVLYIYLLFSFLNLITLFSFEHIVLIMDFFGRILLDFVSLLDNFSIYFSGFDLNGYVALFSFLFLALIFALNIGSFYRVVFSLFFFFAIFFLSKTDSLSYKIFSFKKRGYPDILIKTPYQECFFHFSFQNKKMENLIRKIGCRNTFFFSKNIDYNDISIWKFNKGFLLRGENFKFFIKNKTLSFSFYP
jgi:competence protein ComEC